MASVNYFLWLPIRILDFFIALFANREPGG